MRFSIDLDIPNELRKECIEITGLEYVSDPDKAEAVIFRRNPGKWKNARIFQSLSAGNDRFSPDMFPKGSVLLSNAGGYNEPVAETAFALILSHAKKICQHNQEFHRKKFNRMEVDTLYGKTIGILGYGGIGRKIGLIASAMDMHVLAYSRSRRSDKIAEFAQSPEDIMKRSNIVVISVPLTPETTSMVNRRLLDLFGGSMIVNIARGDIVNREDMLSYLRRNPDKFYLTDVWWNEPTIVDDVPDNCIATPHIAGMGSDFEPVYVKRAAKSLRDYLNGSREHVVFTT